MVSTYSKLFGINLLRSTPQIFLDFSIGYYFSPLKGGQISSYTQQSTSAVLYPRGSTSLPTWHLRVKFVARISREWQHMKRYVVCRYFLVMYVRMDLLHPLSVIRHYSICPLLSIDFAAKPRRDNFIVRSANRKVSASNGDENNKNKGENLSTDWDKAWSNFRKQKKKKLFSNFDMQKYVTRDPRPSDYPLSEEIDPFRKTERSVLDAWTNPKFTVVGFSIVVGLLIFYIVLK